MLVTLEQFVVHLVLAAATQAIQAKKLNDRDKAEYAKLVQEFPTKVVNPFFRPVPMPKYAGSSILGTRPTMWGRRTGYPPPGAKG